MILQPPGSTGPLEFTFWGLVGFALIYFSLDELIDGYRFQDWPTFIFGLAQFLLGSFFVYYMLNKFHIWGWPPWQLVFFY
jgi:hypothetical protein